jgi:hypothetical protein
VRQDLGGMWAAEIENVRLGAGASVDAATSAAEIDAIVQALTSPTD